VFDPRLKRNFACLFFLKKVNISIIFVQHEMKKCLHIIVGNKEKIKQHLR
jgi:hypothetical protein